MNKEIKKEGASVSVYSDPFNKRIRIDHYTGSLPDVLNIIRQEISEWVEKLIVKSRKDDVPFFIAQGFSCEAYIQRYFRGEDMYFMVRYFSPERRLSKNWEREQSIIEKILIAENETKSVELSDVIVATPAEADELATLYAKVFPVYPTPMSDPGYVKKTMTEGTLYVYIREDGEIVSAASAEINRLDQNAELTDCATAEQVQGKGHMKKLLSALEEKLNEEKITCLYTIARAESYAMNKAFFQLRYTYGGRLINNCMITSGLEDMNVWYKNS